MTELEAAQTSQVQERDAENAWVHSWANKIDAAVTVGAAVLFLSYCPDRDDGSNALVGWVWPAAAAALGLSVSGKLPAMRQRATLERIRLAALALVLGLIVGTGNLAVD